MPRRTPRFVQNRTGRVNHAPDFFFAFNIVLGLETARSGLRRIRPRKPLPAAKRGRRQQAHRPVKGEFSSRESRSSGDSAEGSPGSARLSSPPMSAWPRRFRRATAWCLAGTLLGAACRDPKPTPTSSTSESQEHVDAHPLQPPGSEAPLSNLPDDAATGLRIHHADALLSSELAGVEHLDLALSIVDQLGHLEERDVETACQRVDLERIADASPQLRSLRLSGCSEAVSSGIGSFGARLESLTLADVELDANAVQQLGRLSGLKSLRLIRVEPKTDTFRALGRISLQQVELNELGIDSPLGELLELWPRSLLRVRLFGSWVGHKAMTSLAKAESLEELELRDTRVGNYSLNQIKPLRNLLRISFRGDTFNDNSPLYFRELPVRHFSCDCPRLGDGGLRALRHSRGLQHLELRQSRVTGAGLGILSTLDDLRTLIIHDRDIGPEGLRALVELDSLEWLELSGTLEHAKLEPLGELTKLRHLVLDYPEVDDRVAPHLAKLILLEHLGLGGTRVSDEALVALDSLPKLRVLTLDRTRVTNRGLAYVGKLANLERLALDHTDVVDAGVAHLAGLTNLRELTLDHTLVTDGAIDYLMGMAHLERLGLGGTVVTAEGVAKLSRLPNLRAVNLEGTRATKE
jgi:hypothetical protein